MKYSTKLSRLLRSKAGGEYADLFRAGLNSAHEKDGVRCYPAMAGELEALILFALSGPGFDREFAAKRVLERMGVEK